MRWEKQALEGFKGQYWWLDEDDPEILEVPVVVLERWPQITEKLPNKDERYKG